ncbi:MAG TPA: folylpolyglutamate synthase/dihydrofolate synthase family protein [Syntrophomonas sp.]|nr:folylpolyglutamate synthase/dihydrofolate synthase family protein [Syntrophomonas sp.]
MIEAKLQRMSAPGSKPGLERILTLLAGFDDPQQHMPVAHVAGTNGKGSTSLMIADIVSAAGYRVGRFSSPHLHCYEERFIVNGEQISAARLLFYLEQIEERLLSWQGNDCPTEFEILTAIAFLYFKDEKVDLAVLEVGMGGLYDSTNVIKPLVSVITGIDYDHMNILGDTIEEIAFNKAGIIKANVPVVIGAMPEKARKVIAAQAEQFRAPLVKAADVMAERVDAPDLQGQFINLSSSYFILQNQLFALLGDFQLRNLACAVSAIEVLLEKGFTVKTEDLARALPKLKMPGRLEILQTIPLVIGDVAHNPQGAEALTHALQELLPGRKRVLVCGMLDDKDRAASLKCIGPLCSRAVFTRPLGERNRNWHETALLWQQQFPDKPCFELENITAAVKKGLTLLQEDEYLLITGSFYVLEEARGYFLNNLTVC